MFRILLKHYRKFFGILIFLCLYLPNVVLGLKVEFINKNIWLSKEENIKENETIKIYSMILNDESKNVGGNIIFIDVKTNQQVGKLVPFYLPGKGSSQVVSVEWKAIPGYHQFRAKIINAYEIIDGKKFLYNLQLASNLTKQIFIDTDSDKDGLLDMEEKKLGTDPNKPDTDGDGLNDKVDPYPLKVDGDGDGDPDNTDPAPKDPKIRSLIDTDKDGIPDIKDSDDDNDGLYDWEEDRIKTNPKKYDTDGDGVGDKEDFYPLDPKRSRKVNQVKIGRSSKDNLILNKSEQNNSDSRIEISSLSVDKNVKSKNYSDKKNNSTQKTKNKEKNESNDQQLININLIDKQKIKDERLKVESLKKDKSLFYFVLIGMVLLLIIIIAFLI